MNTVLRNTLVAALLMAAIPAQAAIQHYNFNGAMDSGVYNNESFSGAFSFDDAGLTGTGLELVSLSSLNFNFLNTVFGQTDAVISPDVAFQDGILLGLEWTVEQPQLQFTFVAGFADTSDAFVAYDTPLGFSGAGSVTYAVATAPVPEPETYAMMLAGLGLVGFAARRKAG